MGSASGGEMMTQVLVLGLAPCENELKTPGVSYRAEQLLLSLIVNSYHKIRVDVLNICPCHMLSCIHLIVRIYM